MKNSQRLTREQRYTIESLSRQPCSQASIARTLGVHSSRVGREFQRAGMKCDTYCHLTAQKDADSRAGSGKRIAPELLQAVAVKLCTEQWSPEPVSAVFRKAGVGEFSHETICQHIYRDKQAAGKLHLHLRHRCQSYSESC